MWSVGPEYERLLGPFLIYSVNIVICGLTNFLIWNYITKPGNPVCKQVFPKRFVRNAKLSALVLPFAFFVSFMVCWIFNTVWGRYILMLIPLYFRLIKDEPKGKKRTARS